MTGRRILVVDDDPDSREALSELLRLSGHDVLAAADGKMALALVVRDRPEVILLDLGLPDLDGCEVARRLRAAPGGERPFVVGLTGYSREETSERMRASGFDEHMLKPCEPEQLEQLLATVPYPRVPAGS